MGALKFQCDRCKTRYSIADEKVRGRVLKIRCKTCEATITVREDGSATVSAPVAGPAQRIRETRAARPAAASTPAAASSRAAASTPGAASTPSAAASTPVMAPTTAADAPEEWYLSVNGDQIGPLSPEEAQRRVAANAQGVPMYAWRDDFTEWLPVAEVPVLAIHVARAAQVVGMPGPASLALPPGSASPPAGIASLPTTAPEPPPVPEPFDFHIGEVSRLTARPPPPAGAEASLDLRIATASSEMQAVPPAPPPPTDARATPARRRRSLAPLLTAGLGSLVILGVATFFLFRAGEDQDRAAPAAAGAAPGSVLVTNFYSKDNHLLAREAAATPVAVADPPDATRPAPSAPAAGKPRPSGTSRTHAASADPPRLDPAPPRIGPAGKVDSFGGDSADVLGPLTPDDVREAYAANEVGLKRCYERALKDDPSMSVTKLVVKITITADGGVSEIDVPDHGSELSTCAAASIKSWRFRRSTGEFTTEFTVFFARRG